MDRKEFFSKVGFGAALLLVPSCIGGLTSSCSSDGNTSNPPSNVDFTVDTSTGSLVNNGGYIVQNGIIIARTLTGTFLAVSSACTHEGTTVNYSAPGNEFICPNHNAKFSSTGVVTRGPANRNLTQYQVEIISPTLIRVFS